MTSLHLYFLETWPVTRTAVVTFNTAHQSLYNALDAALPTGAAVYISCFLMAFMLVLPGFVPLLAWASVQDNRAKSRPPPPARPPAAAVAEPVAPAAAASPAAGPATAWTVDQVVAWLKAVELGHLADQFTKHDISGSLLLNLTGSEIAADLQVEKLADRKRLVAEIGALRRRSRWWVRWWAPLVQWLRRRWARPPAAAQAKKRD
jgi:SAM domain (Sterile alpha motif).